MRYSAEEGDEAVEMHGWRDASVRGLKEERQGGRAEKA